MTVNDAIDSYIQYQPLGTTSSLAYTFRQSILAKCKHTATSVSPACTTAHVILNYDNEFLLLVSTSTPTMPTATLSHGPRATILVLVTGKLSHVHPKKQPVTRNSPPALQSFLPNDLPNPPPICPCNTPNGSDTLWHLTADHIYLLFGVWQPTILQLQTVLSGR